MTVGRYESAGAITTIDLAGISAGASASMVLVNGGFLIRDKAGDYTGITWGAIGDPASNQGRTELLRYDSPTLAGFVLSASIGEAGDYWGVMLRYAGEFSGFRVAAGIGYEDATDKPTGVGPIGTCGCPRRRVRRTWLMPEKSRPGAPVCRSCTCRPACSRKAITWRRTTITRRRPRNPVTGYWGQVKDHKDSTQWLIQAGITKNWFGFGNTAHLR